MVHELAKSIGKRLLFHCALGERSAMTVQAAQPCHLEGGFAAWKPCGGPIKQ
jgi:sulfur dioxygenase